MAQLTGKIRTAIERGDDATVAMVGELMRAEVGDPSTLDGAEFGDLARRALDDAETLHAMGGIDLTAFCNAHDLAVPAWVAGEDA